MAADVVKKAIEANDIKQGTVVTSATPRGASSKYTGRAKVDNTIETTLFNRLNERFDDTSYYCN